MRRKVRVAGDRDEIYQLRVPPAPIPVAWGRTVQPYVPAHLYGQRSMAGAGVGLGGGALLHVTVGGRLSWLGCRRS